MAKTNQSAKIRAMAQRGQTNGAIAKKLGIRYQTVWRTLNRKFEGIVPQEALVAAGIRVIEEPLLELDEGEAVEQDDEPTEDPESEVVPVEA